MNKDEAANFLGRSIRQLERLTAAKRITSYKLKTAKGQVADFRADDLERLKMEMDEEEGKVEIATLHHDSPLSADPFAEALATTRQPKTEISALTSTALATVPREMLLPDLTASNQSISPVIAEAFAAPLRVLSIAPKMLWTLEEASLLTGLSRARLREAIEKGKLKGGRVGRSFRLRPSDVQKYLNELF